MFKLTLLLGAMIFLVLLIGGEDRGQLRPGLAAAPQIAPATVVEVAAPVAAAEEPAPAVAAPADIAPATAPVVVASATLPVIEPQTAPVQQEEVFSLATFAEPAATPATETAPEAGTTGPVAIVDAGSVNVRSGPGTDFAVLTRLSRGEEVIRIADAGDGWALIRIEGDGVEGYVSTRYLTAP